MEGYKHKVVLLGAGGHAKVILDILKSSQEFEIIGLLDSNAEKIGTRVLDTPVIGTDEMLPELLASGIKHAFVGLGSVKDNWLRGRLYDKLSDLGLEVINVIHPTAIVSDNCELGAGNAVFAGAIVNPGAKVGCNCILNTGCIVEHDVVIGNHVHISPGAVLAGNITIGDYTHIGLGAKIIQGINVGSNSVVGAGAVVIEDVPDNSIVVGVPARFIKQHINV